MIKVHVNGQNKFVEVDCSMLENIVETVIMNTRTSFLSIPEHDYFLAYDSVTMKAAQELTDDYFKMKGREGSPTVKDIEYDKTSHRVKITLEVNVDPGFDTPGYKVPDTLNITRDNE